MTKTQEHSSLETANLIFIIIKAQEEITFVNATVARCERVVVVDSSPMVGCAEQKYVKVEDKLEIMSKSKSLLIATKFADLFLCNFLSSSLIPQ